jgi:hypothetical protein
VSPRVPINRNRLADLCRRFRIAELALFGSVMRDDFRADSDVDVLVTFAPDAHASLFDLADLQAELQDLLGRKVDLVEKPALRNPFRRRAILREAEVVYAAG